MSTPTRTRRALNAALNSVRVSEISADLHREWDELAEEVRRHRDLYYNGQPVITDGEFDELFRRLQRLEEEPVSYTHLTLPTILRV